MDILALSPSVVGSTGGVLCPCGTKAVKIDNGFRHNIPTPSITEYDANLDRDVTIELYRFVDHRTDAAGNVTGWNEESGRTLVDPFA
jgi:hypothetical protein